MFKSYSTSTERRIPMTISTVLLVILVLFLVGALPAWPHSRSWGYGPSGISGLLVLILVVLLLTGRL
jgi:asparagine N-glycosylation enzyme membrane subunit Stt3